MAVKEASLMAQSVRAEGEMETTGKELVEILMLELALQPFKLRPATEKVLVDAGLTVVVFPTVLLLQLYVLAPLAVKVTVDKAHTVVELALRLIAGREYTVISCVA